MIELYTWPEAARLLLTLLIALAVLLQTAAMVLSFQRHESGPGHWGENCLELLVLMQILACSALHGQIHHNYFNSLLAPTGYGLLRILCFAAIVLMAAVVMLLKRKPWPLLVVLTAALTLPMLETACGNAFAYLYVAALLVYPARSIHIGRLRYREIRTSLSALSIKNTIDSLHTGVFFSEPDGFILLLNAQMHRLMQAISGGMRRNGNRFYESLLAGDLEPGCRRVEFQGQIVYLLPDQTAWMFTRTELRIKSKKYIQLTATDITRRWIMTAELQRQEAELKSKGEELSRSIASLHTLSQERETQKAKMRAHDVLGQRLTLLLRTIRSEQALDYELLRSLAQGLLDDLRTDQTAPSPQDELEGLRQTFGSIGVDIEVQGRLPQDRIKGRLFADVIQESVTNAVRHGFATKIWVRIDCSAGAYHLQITNNGYPPTRPIVEGGGISGMRKLVEPCGGALAVTVRPSFAVSVHLPGGADHV
ncbi:MAG: hypothetical protein GX572_05440 [Clostridia bacterium]|nr:hypothetical protein [Clostridia bacterium]